MSQSEEPPAQRRSFLGGLLPFIGVILFVVATIAQFSGGVADGWGPTLVTNAVVYLIGWASVGAGISHIFFSKRIAKTIGFESNDFQKEVGWADLAMGITGLFAASFGPDYWFAIILVSSIFRVGAGIVHVQSMVRSRNFAINNTAILFVDFVVPAFLLFAYFSWAK